MTPFFSVVIPLYNKEDYIEHTLKSVLNQSFNDFEVIIVNDGSTDDSLKIVENFDDIRIKITTQNNKGLSAARNTGIRQAKANYIAFLDADDLWVDNFLKCINELIKTYSKSIVFATNFTSFYVHSQPNLKPNIDRFNTKLVKNYFSLQKNIYASSSLVCHTSIFKSVGYFDETINYGEEEDFALRCFNKYNLAYCNDILVYRLDGIQNQLTAPSKNSKRIIPDYEVYLKDENNKNIKKYIDFIHYKLVILYKMELNYELVKFYKKNIDPSNLSFIKKIKFYLPTKVFYYLKTIYLKIFRVLS